MSARIYSTDKYDDIVPMGKRLFIFTGLFTKEEITHKIVSVQRNVLDSRTNMPDAILKGVLGTAVGGLFGTFLGVALAKEDPIVQYIVKLKEFEPSTISFVTSDRYLDDWLVRWMERR